ncbi:MAG: DUF4445 domain-containing protein, partial [Anaerohalosphaera sp.]|nr:DUF4445 domain-containing protein [Anaerohalosphaera sp.]
HIHPLSDGLTQLYKGLVSTGNTDGVTALLHQLPDCERPDATCYNYLTFEQGDTTARLFGIAVDIGTTTVVAKLMDFASGNCIATAATANPQIRFGDDVISRVAFAKTDQQLNEIHEVIIGALNTLIDQLCREAAVFNNEIYEMVLAGNTAMNHIFLRFPIHQLGQAPYEPYSTKSHQRSSAEMKLNINPAGSIYTIENIAGFIGADTTAAALAVGMDIVRPMTLLVDIGTNGELVLGTKDKMYAASCAAGPALEGARITQGSRAVEGAIEAVVINDADIDIDVIGFKPPASICGSGLIDALAVLLELGVVDYTGAFADADKLKETLPPAIFDRLTEHNGEKAFRLTDNASKDLPEVVLTQRDFRQAQLAKGAIRAGIQLLVQKMGITEQDIDQILLAGAFGNYIRRESACRIGLLPNLPIERIHFVGNAASSGAQLALLSGSFRNTACDLAAKIEYVELANEMDFQMFFADAMLFD